MDGSDYLLTTAEVATALAGFAALVVAIRQDAPQGAASGFVVTLIERCLMAILLSLLPLLLTGLSVPSPRVWLVSSGLLAAYILSLAIRGFNLREREPMAAEMVSRPSFILIYLVGVFVLVLQFAHALGLWLSQSVWWYLVGLTWLLATVCYLFYFFIRGWARDA